MTSIFARAVIVRDQVNSAVAFGCGVERPHESNSGSIRDNVRRLNPGSVTCDMEGQHINHTSAERKTSGLIRRHDLSSDMLIGGVWEVSTNTEKLDRLERRRKHSR